MRGKKRLTTPLQERLMQNYLNAQTKQQKQEAFNALFACDYELLNNLALKLEKEVGQDYFTKIVDIYKATIQGYKPHYASSYLGRFLLKYGYFYDYKHGISKNGAKSRTVTSQKPITFSNAQELENLLLQPYYDGESALIKGVLLDKILNYIPKLCNFQDYNVVLQCICDEKSLEQIKQDNKFNCTNANISLMKRRGLKHIRRGMASKKIIKDDFELYRELPAEPQNLCDI